MPPRLLLDWEFYPYRLLFYTHDTMPLLPACELPKEVHLYNHPNYLQIQVEAPYYTLKLLHISTQKSQWMHFQKVNETLINSYRAPWGGWEGTPTAFPQNTHLLKAFLNEICQLLSVKTIETTFPPVLYRINSYSALWGVETAETHFTCCLRINEQPFYKRIHANEVRRWKKCINAGIAVQPVQIDEDLYRFMEQCYQERNYTLSISYSLLADLVKNFPNSYYAVGAFFRNTLIAACLVVRVNKHISYHYIPATALAWKSFSPMVLLYDYLYTACQTQGVAFLDLGTSVDKQGQLHPSLQNFKLRMGGEIFPKYRYRFYYQGRTSS